MNSFQRANIRRQMIRALKIAGATPWAVTRVERDANGIPTGRELEVAWLYGLRYQRVSQLGDLLQLAMPGIMAKGSGSWRWIGLVTHGDPPREGDTLRGCDTEAKQIIGVQESLGVMQLTLGGIVV